MANKPGYLVLVFSLCLSAVSLLGVVVDTSAQTLGGTTGTSNVRATRHNLSSTPPTRRATSENSATTEAVISGSASEVCVFCHTPHAAVTQQDAPLWNRSLSTQVYTGYSSSSIDATDLDVTTGTLGTPSKLCLSCHDGSVAIGAVSNSPGSGMGSGITTTGYGTTAPSPAGTMPYGRNQGDAEHGYTRRLGTDLRNDHPISFTYDTTLANADGELRDPAGSAAPAKIANRQAGTQKPDFPLANNRVQCNTCHDPHKNTQKFLRKNRLAQGTSTQSFWNNWTFDDANDQICLGCHTRLGKAWQQSAHADSVAGNEIYKTGDAALRDFPTGTKVWQAGCLNCHDTHTVAGSRRLLREGVSNNTTSLTPATIGYAATFRSGTGNSSASDYNSTSSVENACYQCHSSTAVISPTTLSATEGVPNIAGEFSRTYRMPITNGDQGDSTGGNTVEKHDITDRDGMESQSNLGYGMKSNRHVECSDCHNPHRVVKADTYLGAALTDGDITRRTHVPARGTKGEYGNIASGALRGAWGLEPSYTAAGQTTVTTSTVWMSASENPSFTVKKGDPGAATSLPVGAAGTNTATYLTREYQLCFKCHSSYANGPLAADFPQLKSPAARGGTARGTNSVDRYTNVAAEFAVRATDPPSTGLDQGESNGSGFEPTPSNPAGTNNHRSWHPVVFPTGRTPSERGNGSWNNVRPPFNTAAKIGYQTMQCSDCHGSAASWTQGSDLSDTANGPSLAQVQGPHGSENPFILKGVWSTSITPSNVSGSNSSNSICGRCHDPRNATSGFAGSSEASHGWEVKATRYCMFCHIAVPHGWKNKAFLVNLKCVQGEAGSSYTGVGGACQAKSGEFTAGPYYNQARLEIESWARSGNWQQSNCGGESWMSTACGT